MLRGRFPRLLTALALLAVLTAGGEVFAGDVLGGGAATMPAATVDSDLAALVPEGTHILVYAPSMDDFVAKIKHVAAAFDPDMADQMTVDMLLEQHPLGAFVDTAKPMALAVSLPNGPDGPSPDMTIISAVTDVTQAEEHAKAMGITALPSAGTFVALRMGEEPAVRPATPSAIASGIAAGDLAIRIDLASLITLYRDMADGALSEMDKALEGVPGGTVPGMDEMMGAMKKSMKDFLDGAETLDMALGLDGTMVHWKGLLTGKDGSELVKTWSMPAGDGGAMAAALPADWPVAMVMSFDIKKLYDWMEPMMGTYFEMMPEESRPQMEILWKKALALSDYMGDHHAIAYDLGADGIRGVVVSELTDAEKYFAAYDQLLTDPAYTELMASMGIEMAVLPSTEVAGIVIRHFRMSFDIEKMMTWNQQAQDLPPEAVEMMQGMFETMFGKDGMEMHAANVGGKLVAVVGDEILLLAIALRCVVSDRVGEDTAMGKALALAGGKPSFLVRMELRALLEGAFSMARSMAPPEQADQIPTLPEGGPIPLVMYASVDGRYATGGYAVDAGAIAGLVGYFMSVMEDAMSAGAPVEAEAETLGDPIAPGGGR